MPRKREEQFFDLIVPNINLVVVAATDEQRLRLMKCNGAYGACSQLANSSRKSGKITEMFDPLQMPVLKLSVEVTNSNWTKEFIQ